MLFVYERCHCPAGDCRSGNATADLSNSGVIEISGAATGNAGVGVSAGLSLTSGIAQTAIGGGTGSVTLQNDGTISETLEASGGGDGFVIASANFTAGIIQTAQGGTAADLNLLNGVSGSIIQSILVNANGPTAIAQGQIFGAIQQLVFTGTEAVATIGNDGAIAIDESVNADRTL